MSKYNKFINEVLEEINKNPRLLIDGEYKKFGNGGPLGVFFKHAFDPDHRFLLPEGEPPYRKIGYPQGRTPIIFQQEIMKFYIYCRKDIKPTKLQTPFIQFLEGIHEKEAKILIAVKDQNLTSLYPNITPEIVFEAGFIDKLPPKEVVEAPLVESQGSSESSEPQDPPAPKRRTRKKAS